MIKFLHMSDVHLGCRRYNLEERTKDFFRSWHDVITTHALPNERRLRAHRGRLFRPAQHRPADDEPRARRPPAPEGRWHPRRRHRGQPRPPRRRLGLQLDALVLAGRLLHPARAGARRRDGRRRAAVADGAVGRGVARGLLRRHQGRAHLRHALVRHLGQRRDADARRSACAPRAAKVSSTSCCSTRTSRVSSTARSPRSRSRS